MRKLNLRLTEEQYELLRQQASQNRRSLQGEMLYRLFPPKPLVPAPEELRAKAYAAARKR